MSKMKDIMMKGMNLVMLDCDQATYLAVRAESEELGWVKKLQLKMHLMGCKFCKSFVEQSHTISEEVDLMKAIDPDHFEVELTEEQVVSLKKVVQENNS